MALTRRRITKKSIKEERRILGKERKTLPCKSCGLEVDGVGVDIKAIICADCCMKMSAPPDIPQRIKPESERRPRGWQFMKEYRAPDGTLYRRGEKVNEETNRTPSHGPTRSGVRKTASNTTSDNNRRHSKRTGGTKAGRTNANSSTRAGTSSNRKRGNTSI